MTGLGGEDNTAEDPIGLGATKKLQMIVIPVSPQAKTGTQDSLRNKEVWIPDICCANSGMTTNGTWFLGWMAAQVKTCATDPARQTPMISLSEASSLIHLMKARTSGERWRPFGQTSQ